MKKNCLFICIICLFLVLLNSCASTDIEGIKKTGVNFYEYNKVVVYCNLENIKYRKLLENELCKQFNKQNKTALKSIELLPPLKEYTADEIINSVSSTNAELLIEIKILSANTNNGSSSSVFMPVGGMYFGSGSTEIKLNMDFDIKIYDIKNDYEIIFRGTASSEDESDELDDCIENVFESFSEELVNQYFVLPQQKK